MITIFSVELNFYFLLNDMISNSIKGWVTSHLCCTTIFILNTNCLYVYWLHIVQWSLKVYCLYFYFSALLANSYFSSSSTYARKHSSFVCEKKYAWRSPNCAYSNYYFIFPPLHSMLNFLINSFPSLFRSIMAASFMESRAIMEY